jgi:DNA-binding response OmpR family regulator
MYLEIALKTTDPQELVHTYNGIQKDLQGLQGDAPEHADLVIHSDFQVREKVRGPIEFKNQQTLQSLLRLFIENPGRIFTKEELIGKIWGEDYNPSVHDNKIYVTIKRLRHLIEPELDHPRYIFRSKNGYFFNKEAKIEIRG